MRHCYIKVFRDKEKLTEMLRLRSQGVLTTILARHYGVDHSSILYQCRKYNIIAGKEFIFEDIMNATETKEERRKANLDGFKSRLFDLQKPQFEINGDKINQGKKSYADYLKASGYNINKLKHYNNED
jgi:hypothetical protein